MIRFGAILPIVAGVLLSANGHAAERPPSEEPDASRSRLDAWLDATSMGGASGGWAATFAPLGPLDSEGLRLLLHGEAGAHEAVKSGVLFGYGWVRGDAGVTALLGADVQGNRWSGKLTLESYVNPTERVLLYGYGTYATAHDRYFAHAKVGYAFFADVYLGPEALFLGDDSSAQQRAGVHVTGVEIGPLEIDLSAGWVHDRARGPGGYTLSGVGMTF